MSNDRQETIADIVTKMLEFAETDSQTIGRDVLRRRIQHFVASIIEAAMKRERKAGAEAAQICGEVGEMVGREAACRQPVTDCHVLGNAGGNPRMKALCERAHNIMHNAAAKREREAGAAAAHQLEVAELRECLVRRSSHLNAILQTALELRNGVPPELRKVMDECIVEEDKAVGLGVFSKKGAEDEGE